MKHTVYKTTNLVNGKYYIGKHSCSNRCGDQCSYLGSGYALLKAIEKYGEHNFCKEVLLHFETEEEAYQYESDIITKEMIDSNECYNGINGGKGCYVNESRRSIGCTIDDIYFKSYGAAARHFCVSNKTIARWISKGGKSLSLKKGGKDAIQVVIDSIVFKSYSDAARHFKVSTNTIKRWAKNNGRSNYLRKNMKNFTLGGILFKSTKEAAEYFQVHRTTIVKCVNSGRVPKIKNESVAKNATL